MKIHTRTQLIATLIVLPLIMTGCGIKPHSLEAPTPEKTQDFPAIYPQKTK